MNPNVPLLSCCYNGSEDSYNKEGTGLRVIAIDMDEVIADFNIKHLSV
ncbi:hypothetical protein SAMN04487895_11685 [Paenibacillus sophorae]|uniref:Uncharacterized protein n=1 Tax=Paenibacillus sophorae TaxID=1333845 RepID=A0A1H8U7Y3_9BACL|nr:hypothetical protein SAMN04487895_11685 [Paenibacillus sophorae]